MGGGALAGAVALALWLGVLTSIGPCPLATNIVALSFIARRARSPAHVVWTGLLYTAGRALGYLALAIVLVAGLLSMPTVSYALQRHMNRLLGPVLILAGMVLLGLVRVPAGERVGLAHRLAQRAARWEGGAVLLGILFALSFCPVSAALFFGSLIPLAVAHRSGVLLPALYGVGTALPVVAFALLTALGATWIGRAFDVITRAERWTRGATGVIFIVVGIYYALAYIFHVVS